MLTNGIDSGAAASVLPLAQCTDYPIQHTSDKNISYRAATNQPVMDKGMRALMGYLGDSPKPRGNKFRVTDVTKALLAVSEMVDAGYRIVFDRADGVDISHAVHKESDDMLGFTQRNKIYEVEVQVMPDNSEAVD